MLNTLRPGSKVFVDGDYRFPVEEDSAAGYIEMRSITFNTTNRTTQAGSAPTGTGATGGEVVNRRTVAVKSPQQPKRTSVRPPQPPPKPALSNDDSQSFSFTDFTTDPSPKRGNDGTTGPENVKRLRKPRTKGNQEEDL
jgi:hypothetical protein